MKQFIKNDWWKISALAIFIIAIVGWFYWYGFRPAQIRHDCSWVKKHAGEWLERTQSQYDECMNNCKNRPISDNSLLFSFPCSCEQPHPYRSPIDWYEPASSAYYTFCIHEKGL